MDRKKVFLSKKNSDCIFVNGIQKRSKWQLEFRKTDPFWQFGETFLF